MNDEILSGLKAARDRGFSVESAAASFINAGYNKNEVDEAATLLLRGFSPLPSSVKESTVSSEKIIPKETPFASNKLNNSVVLPKKDVSSKTIWIALIIIGLVFIGAIIFISIFHNQFLGLIDAIFP